ncbi:MULTISPECIES: DUF1120 domain-containing protein [Pseudomonas]|uniref:DUF1120 domain-containing protein n=1 Tax=Pseudomonas TaxID=286 RepID=UPI001BEA7084|nr:MULTISPECIES: DUF1120 domain-containing protein [Pseudomonas]MBT2340319.1 DUF1120 domain-containing protein [Pseudomonas fluorescens]MCD4530327.1 DUF1120 domain-containing protein [Pseudomonas sp. C3-2018]
MKNKFGLAAVVALVLACAHVQAADLQVAGSISPGSCSLNIPTLAVDYGRISANDLSPIDYTSLGKRNTPFNITCDGPTLVGLTAVDNRVASKKSIVMTVLDDPMLALPVNCYGLGTNADGAKIGAFSLHVRNYSVDGNTNLQTIMKIGNSWMGAGDIVRNDRTVLSWAPIRAYDPQLLTRVTGELEVEAVINNTTELVVQEDIQIDGNATLELAYI